MKTIFPIILFVAISFAQVTREWARYYNGPANLSDYAKDIEVDTNGYVYVAGSSYNGVGGSDITLVKYDPSGQQLWVERYNLNNGIGAFERSTLDHEGNIILTGHISYNYDSVKVITIKYNPQGQLLWSRIFFSPDYFNICHSITTDNDGNIYVVGRQDHRQIDAERIFTIKYNASGDLQWVKYYGSQGYADIYDLDVDSFGNVYISGVVGVHYDEDVKIVTIKYTSAGVEQWVSITDTSPNSYVIDVSLDDSGNIYVVGSQYDNNWSLETFIMKYNNSGSLVWTQIYLGQYVNKAAVNPDGDLYFTSYKYVNGLPNSSIVKYNSAGVIQWESLYEHPALLIDLVLDEVGNVYAAGLDPSTLYYKYLTVKYNRDGIKQWVEKNDSINNAQEFPYAIALDKGGNVYVTGYSSIAFGPIDYLTIKYSQQKRNPVLIVPGIAGTYSSDVNNDLLWLLNRGVSPDKIQIDPLANVYTDLITTLQNVGYEKDKDLFIVNYDWRLLPAPIDNNFDGYIEGLTGQSISDNQFNYGVDYLGYYLREAANRWRIDYNEELDYVDVIVHSTGGLVTRSYIQSSAYGDVYDAVNNYKLPRIRNFMMIGVPNRGASKAWNPLHDNWIADPAYRFVLSKIINRAYQKIKKGYIITGPDHYITWGSILDSLGNPDKVKFINKYVPTIRGLLATYNFLDIGSGPTNVNSNPSERNNLILDLNNGYDLYPNADPNGFLDSATVYVLFGNGQNTFDYVQERTDGEINAIQSFTDWTRTSVFPGTLWYKDMISNIDNGDGTVPLQSAVGQFLGDSRATLFPFGVSDHTGMVQTIPVQSTVLDILNINYDQSTISTGSGADVGNVLSIISDPVETLITDGLGRRVGYTNSTGKLTEIPNSLWIGNTEGMGYVFGSVPEPITLQLTGLGEEYYVMVSAEDSNKAGGVVLEGFLAGGAIITYQITLQPLSVEKLESLNPDIFTLAQNYPNPFNPTTTIQYSIPQRGKVLLKVYDLLGNEVATLVNEEKDRGVYSVNFDASHLPSGIYLYRLQAGNFIQTKKMILIK